LSGSKFACQNKAQSAFPLAALGLLLPEMLSDSDGIPELADERVPLAADEQDDFQPCRRRRYLANGLIAALAVAGVIAICRSSYSWVGSERSEDVEYVEDLWWVPNPGHFDQAGHPVADTWDHFVMPQCDIGPVEGMKKRVTHIKKEEGEKKKSY